MGIVQEYFPDINKVEDEAADSWSFIEGLMEIERDRAGYLWRSAFMRGYEAGRKTERQKMKKQNKRLVAQPKGEGKCHSLTPNANSATVAPRARVGDASI